MSRQVAIIVIAALFFSAAATVFFIGLALHEPELSLEDELIRSSEEYSLSRIRRNLAEQDLILCRNMLEIQVSRGDALAALLEAEPSDSDARGKLNACMLDIKRLRKEIPDKEKTLALLDEVVSKSRDILILLCGRAGLDVASADLITSGSADAAEIRGLLAKSKARVK